MLRLTTGSIGITTRNEFCFDHMQLTQHQHSKFSQLSELQGPWLGTADAAWPHRRTAGVKSYAVSLLHLTATHTSELPKLDFLMPTINCFLHLQNSAYRSF